MKVTVGFGLLVLSILLGFVKPSLAAEKSCPKNPSEAAGKCDVLGQSCSYAAGQCNCERPRHCSGLPQPPGESRWVCKSPRTDGCPTGMPVEGKACKAKQARSCSYGACASITLGCIAGKWKVTAANGPPPGSPQQTVAPKTLWKVCPSSSIFQCTPRSQGFAPPRGEEVPIVCGCMGPCNATVIAREVEGRWPDGSRKGAFSCAQTSIPAANPQAR
jgi:hypothetical protein